MKTFKAILKPIKDSKEGFIYIQEIDNRVKAYVSMKIKIPIKLWNKEAEAVRKTKLIDYEQINSIIEKKKAELKGTQTVKVNKLSFTDFFKKYIERINNEGSRIKYEQIFNKIKEFKLEILYTDITVDFIYALQKHFLKTQEQNTSNHYLKLTKQVLNEAIKEKEVVYSYYPFLNIKFKYTPIQKNSLNELEIDRIINTYIEPTELEYNTRNKFLFQIFSQGMRVSDIMLLKWKNLIDNKIDYKMFKTGKEMKIELNDILSVILIHQYKEFVKNNYIHTPELNSLEQELDELIDSRNKHLTTEHNILSGFELLTADMFEHYENTTEYFNKVAIKKEQIYHSYLNHIDYLTKTPKYNTSYIFDFIDFEIKNVKKPTKVEYRKLKNKSIVYNRQLKVLQKKVGSSTNFKSHLSRHTYASLLLNNDTNIFVIAQSLGHSRIAITEKYLSGFDNRKTGDENKKIADRFKGRFLN